MKFLNSIDGADKLVEDANNRLVTDAEKATWNAKANSSHALSTHSDVAVTVPTSGQVLKWNGTAWAPGTDNDSNTTYSAGSGIGLSGTTFSVAGGNGLAQEASGLALGTPSTVTNATTNSVTTTSHTHALTLTKADITGLGIPAQDTVYTHPTTTGNKHIPSGGATGQFLKWSADGTAVWSTDNDTVYTHPTTAGNLHIPAGGSSGQILRWSALGTAVWGVDNDTVYTHPANHPASIITQDASNRFVTDAEKATWNAKGTSNLALGTTSTTAYRGDYGNTAYTHSQSAHIALGTTSTTAYRGDYGNTAYTHSQSAHSPFTTLSATTPATINWYRIATSAVNIGANSGLFKVDFSGTGVKGSALFRASNHDGVSVGTNINQLGYTSTNLSLGMTKVRVVYHTTATANYAYVDVYNPTALAIAYTVDLIDSTGWTLVAPSTVGSIPSGYTSEELILDTGFVSNEDVIAGKQLKSLIATGTAPLVVSSTTVVPNLNASMVSGFTVGKSVPAGAVFTDTVYTHPTTSGNKHIPSGGASGQFLKWSADGTAVWASDNNTVYTHPANHPPSIITQDASNRFVTDAQITSWNAKGTSNLALGTTSTTAYRGDYGNTAYTHSQATHAPTNAQANQTITSGNGMASWTATSGNLTVSLGTPGSLTGSTTNALTATSHTHAVSLTADNVGAVPKQFATQSIGTAFGWYRIASIPAGSLPALAKFELNFSANVHLLSIEVAIGPVDAVITQLSSSAAGSTLGHNLVAVRVQSTTDISYVEIDIMGTVVPPTPSTLKTTLMPISGNWSLIATPTIDTVIEDSYPPLTIRMGGGGVDSSKGLGQLGKVVVTSAPTTGQVLKWTGTHWAPGTDNNSNTTYIAGNGLSLTSTTFALGTPGTLTGSTTNATTSTSHTHSITTSYTGASSTIMQTDSSGDAHARLFRSTYANQSTISGAMAFRTNNSTDNYIRFCSDATAIRTFLSAGSLDGSIIERGSNTNGTYLKFGNGEMICYGYNTFVTPTCLATGSIFGHGTGAYRTNTFPATFYSAPSIDMMVHIGESWCSLRTISTTDFTWRYYAYMTWTVGTTKDFFWKAHGRWKA